MKQVWNGRTITGNGLVIEGKVSAIVDSADTLAFRVDTDGVLHTVSMLKADAQIRVTGEGITITEAKRNA